MALTRNQTRPVDWPTHALASLELAVDALRVATERHDAIQQDLKRKKIRWNRVENAIDDLLAAERELCAVQRDIGVPGNDTNVTAAKMALTAATASSRHWLQLVGVRLEMPGEVWQAVTRGLLPDQVDAKLEWSG
mmetsp:Transcript_85881/g.152085  ORF Transcript_85881/g.152085 Transcript_85881/m.152085 type:complete len:135 (-) Transcript_85881:86-490(-)